MTIDPNETRIPPPPLIVTAENLADVKQQLRKRIEALAERKGLTLPITAKPEAQT